MKSYGVEIPPSLFGWSDTQKGWVSVADHKRMHEIRKVCAVARARYKLTVLEWNAMAGYIKAQVLEDQQIEHP